MYMVYCFTRPSFVLQHGLFALLVLLVRLLHHCNHYAGVVHSGADGHVGSMILVAGVHSCHCVDSRMRTDGEEDSGCMGTGAAVVGQQEHL